MTSARIVWQIQPMRARSAERRGSWKAVASVMELYPFRLFGSVGKIADMRDENNLTHIIFNVKHENII
jgi:hypothetical protein